MSSEPAPRILVEGGPIDRRTKHALAALVGIVIGGLLGTGGVALVALNAAHDAHHAANRAEQAIIEVKQARGFVLRQACREADERHITAYKRLEQLARKTEPPGPSLAARRRQRSLLKEFVEALAPEYNCPVRVREQTSP